MARVERGDGPSSNVDTTSPGARKSGLPCGAPNHGPPLVSIAIVRETPMAPGVAQADCACAGRAATTVTHSAQTYAPTFRMKPPFAQSSPSPRYSHGYTT